jgi:hypothetical protein
VRHNETGLNVVTQFLGLIKCNVAQLLQVQEFLASPGTIGCNQQLGFAVIHTLSERVRRETSELRGKKKIKQSIKIQSRLAQSCKRRKNSLFLV